MSGVFYKGTSVRFLLVFVLLLQATSLCSSDELIYPIPFEVAKGLLVQADSYYWPENGSRYQPDKAFYNWRIAFHSGNASADIAHNLAACFYRGEGVPRDRNQALALWKRALKIDPNHKESLHGIALCAFYDNNDEMAIEACEKALETDPEYQEALILLGACYLTIVKERTNNIAL